MQFSDPITLVRSDKQYRLKRGIFNLYQIVYWTTLTWEDLKNDSSIKQSGQTIS